MFKVLLCALALSPLVASAPGASLRHAPSTPHRAATPVPKPMTVEQADASAKGLLRTRMSDFDRTALASARDSGRTFPLYRKWLISVSAAVRQGLSPAALVSAPGSNPLPSRTAQTLVDDASAAEREIADFIPPAMEGHDLVRIKAFKDGTHPTSLNKVLLTVFEREPPEVRSAAADRMRADYALPQ